MLGSYKQFCMSIRDLGRLGCKLLLGNSDFCIFHPKPYK